MKSIHKIATIQMSSQNHMDKNIQTACRLIKKAATEKAICVFLPENVAFMSKNREELLENSFPVATHPALLAFQKQAKAASCWIQIGSLAIKEPKKRKIYNRAFLINPSGEIVSYYDKIHLYDVNVTGGESHRESAHCITGDKNVISNTPFGQLGLTICYDIRFPHLYRQLALNGAELISVPAAFTYYTGEAHWEILLRSRAIETGCYIIAAAQYGPHPSGRKTFGHSMIIDPWGTIIAQATNNGTDEIIMADIDLTKVTQTRKQIPSLYLNRKIKQPK